MMQFKKCDVLYLFDIHNTGNGETSLLVQGEELDTDSILCTFSPPQRSYIVIIMSDFVIIIC